MRDEAAESSSTPRARLWLRRLGWLLLFWMSGVLVMGVAAYCLKLVMRLAGLTT